MVNDIHGKNDNLARMLGRSTKENTDIVFFNGDMVSILENESDIFTGFMDKSVELFASEVPVFLARGNHETRGRAGVTLYNYFPPTGSGRFYYSLRHGPVHFLILDGGEDKPDSDIEYSELARFDSYRSEEQKWIEEQVNDPLFLSAPIQGSNHAYTSHRFLLARHKRCCSQAPSCPQPGKDRYHALRPHP